MNGLPAGRTVRDQEPGHALVEMNVLRAELQMSNAKMVFAIQVIFLFHTNYERLHKYHLGHFSAHTYYRKVDKVGKAIFRGYLIFGPSSFEVPLGGPQNICGPENLSNVHIMS